MKFALLSVTNKSGIIAFANGLKKLGFTILSTGGTANVLRQEGIEVTDVADFTGSPEILDGRVKTLHPKIHGGILYDRSNPQHLSQISQYQIQAISVVAVNLYDFDQGALAGGLSPESAIEHIDIGGPTMLRAAAKNWQHCLSIIDPDDYTRVLENLEAETVDRNLRLELAIKTFKTIARYDGTIAAFFGGQLNSPISDLNFSEPKQLRYGENPHQRANFLKVNGWADGFSNVAILQGKELSYNNYLDLENACRIVRSFAGQKAITIVKHTNPCGVAVGDREEISELYERALASDPKSAFGGIIACNHELDGRAASVMKDLFLECIAAPSFTEEARAIFGKKPNLRLLVVPWLGQNLPADHWEYRSIEGGFLVQQSDDVSQNIEDWKVVTNTRPEESQLTEMIFAMKVAAHVKSNAIVIAKNRGTMAIGAGQMSRIDAAQFAVDKALQESKDLAGAVLASDAFFPFQDVVVLAATVGISAIIQPGGSMRDQESIDAANRAGIAMVFSGKRHFRH
jgi:phosphoribosylaminoimidazolecarboxamide formyltransferase/IMP cyclohydrolase